MSVAIKRELIEDNLEVTDSVCAEPLKKKVRTARKCTGVGGKLPREPIKSKPLRKISLPVPLAPVRIMPMRSVRTRSKPLVQTIQDSDDSDIRPLVASSSYRGTQQGTARGAAPIVVSVAASSKPLS